MHETGPKGRDLSVEVVSLLCWHKAHAQHVLTCCPNIHGEEIMDSLRIESLGVEVGKGGGNFLKALCCFLHGGLVSQDNRARFDVAMNLKMSTQTAECEFDPVLKLSGNGVLARGSPHLYLGGL